jgi:hypothetical protein
LSLFGALIIKLSPINNFNDWGLGIRRYFYQIKSALLGSAKGITPRQNTKLLPILIDDP